MNASQVTIEWLKTLEYIVQPAGRLTIEGIRLRDLSPIVDGRGEVTELWSQPWVDKHDLSSVEHVYQSATDFGVVKCWHLHDAHTDQFTVTRGKLQVALVDLREQSPTFRHVNSVFLGTHCPRLLKIPPMIMHGWKALSLPEVIVVNFQSAVYIPGDEFRFPWNCVLEDVWEPKHG